MRWHERRERSSRQESAEGCWYKTLQRPRSTGIVWGKLRGKDNNSGCFVII